ncbi:MAG: NADH-ubiquinone oxidoreductase-F iron-sulfur binding region domain-containing protein [Myxococcota bacterium]|jgi:NADH-quinone oxidoreductase subunit F|nr:NADH-ubiquinone oxidoreductase-F iron-sulfur binding region domain-containing protein [Myxococcota bacterium]
MMIQSSQDLAQVKHKFLEQRAALPRRLVLCAGTGCVANGALKVFAALEAAVQAAGLEVVLELREESHGPKDVWLSHSGCQGFCQMGPLLLVEPEGYLYTKVRVEDVDEIVQESVQGGRPVERLLYVEPSQLKPCLTQHDIPFYRRQHRMTLELCGRTDPDSLAEYIAEGGYAAACDAYRKLSPEAICEELIASGLRGRGGGGFATGRKWLLTLRQSAKMLGEQAKRPIDKKYIICNGDEGDPGAFMDRSVMEGNPHSVLEGMLIAGRAVGADEGYVYVRAEYPLAVQRLRKAVADASDAGLLGDNVFGSGCSFDIHVMEGAGAFVCGEETALISSIEGRRGMPSPKPPFPAQSGLWGKPTVINNVETLATVPLIMRMGAAAFRRLGSQKSPGTKTFALTGHVVNTGLIEVPLGTSLREIVFAIGGGVTDDAGRLIADGFKAVQIGGPSGGCLTREQLDLPLDFDSLQSVGAMVGSGGLVVINNKSCMVKLARFFMQFTQNESCGKCVLCREGTCQMLALLDDIIEGRGSLETLSLLEELGLAIKKGSLCGLGKTAPNPVLSTLRQFRAEYEAHVVQKRCPAGQCKALVVPSIDPERCRGCGLCARKCPVSAISGEKRKPYQIDPTLCIRCGVCAQACKFDAVLGLS